MNLIASLTYRMAILFFMASWGLPGYTNQEVSGSDINVDGLDTYVEGQMRQNQIPGMALAITFGDQILYLQGYGDAAPNQPVTPQTPFYIGSVSKSFTALAAMQLSEAGQLDLDAPVRDYLPWFQVADEAASSTITVRHLLNQTSGLAGGAQINADISPDAGIEEAVKNLKDVKPVQQPGSSYHYFNPNYTVLGLLVEAASGQSYADYLQQHIFAPLDMPNSFTSAVPARQAGLAQGYGQAFGFPIHRHQPHLAYDLPAGFIISTAEDMAHYLVAQINAGQYSSSQVLSPTGIEAMHQPPMGIDSSYAMGWESGNIDGVRTIEHSGALETFYARAILLPEQKIGLAVLINQNGLINLITFEQMSDNFVRLLLGSEPQGRPSLSLIYTGINTIIALDLVWKSIALLRVRKWQAWAAGKSRTRQRLDIALGLALPVLIVIGIPAFSLATLGATGTRVMFYYYVFDIALWIGVTALLSIALGLIKIRIFHKRIKPS